MRQLAIKERIKNRLSVAPIEYIQYLIDIKNKVRSTKIISEYISTHKNPKLQIGCGCNPIEGWLNTDLVPIKSDVCPIAFLDAGKQFPFESNSFEYVYSEHIFEHLSFSQSWNMLSECHRILTINGVIRIAIPHIDFLFALYEDPEFPIHKKYTEWAMESFCEEAKNNLGVDKLSKIYVINNFFRNWGHQIIHNFDSLKQLLEKHDFSDIQRKEIGLSDIDELKGIENHGEGFSEEFNKLETLVVEAKKSG